MGVVLEVEIVEITLANRNDFYQFMRAYPCLPTPSRPNTSIKFRLTDAFKPPLTNLRSLLKSSAWADLLAQYPGGLQMHLPMVLRFEAELGYQDPDAFILLENLASALEDPLIIEKKLQEDLALGLVVPVHQSSRPFICSILSLVPKYDEG